MFTMTQRRESIRKKLGDILVDASIITRQQLTDALEEQKKQGKKLGEVLIDLGYVTKDTLFAVLGKQRGVTFISLREIGEIPADAIKAVPKSLIKKRSFVPIYKDKNSLTVAIHDPNDVTLVDDVRAMTGFNINVVVAVKEEIDEAIAKYFSEEVTMNSVIESLDPEKLAEEDISERESQDGDLSIVNSNAAPVIKMVNIIITDAVKKRASDIHIEPYEKKLRMRYRIDGVLLEAPAPPKTYQNAIVSRLKIMSKLDISEHRLPQDGNMALKVANKDIDFRVSVIPVKYGEKVVIRILDPSGMCQNLGNLGLDMAELTMFKKAIESPHGLILVTGPTGSGKTTTLYSGLSSINDPELNISTIEDPVEYSLDGVNQVQVKPDIGLTFASGLRAFLRQDPDIILVGEIRDVETVEVAIQASLTGHLVLSTLHTNDAASTIVRLLNMGVEPFLITASLTLVVAQRIVRVICDKCKEEYTLSSAVLRSMGYTGDHIEGKETVQLWRGRGCENCGNTGYRGRIAVYEIMEMNNKLRELVLQRGLTHNIRQAAMENGMTSLTQNAFRKVLSGITTLEELARVVFTADK